MKILLALGMALCCCIWLSGGALAAGKPTSRMQLTVYKGGFATVNSFIFSNGKALLVMDVQRKTYEAKKLADVIRAMKLPLEYILISHGHTDHFTGMSYFHQAFPKAEIVVASEDIKRDIKAYAIYMDSGGETGAEPALEPALKPKSAANPNGFDYENNIHVLKGNQITLAGGGTLELTSDYKPAEAKHTTTVYSKDLNALFISDLGYNKVHLWMGDDISKQDVANWRQALVSLKSEYAGLNPAVYPGHGDVSDMGLFASVIGYIDNFTRITSEAPSRQAAMMEMEALYPDYKEANFFLKYSVENFVK